MAEVSTRKLPPVETRFTAENCREFQRRGILARIANTKRLKELNSEPALRELAKKRILFLLAGINGPTNAMKLANAYATLCEAEQAEKRAKPAKPDKPAPSDDPTADILPENFGSAD